MILDGFSLLAAWYSCSQPLQGIFVFFMDFFLEDFVVFFSTQPYKTLKLRKNLQDDFGMLAVVVFPH